MSKEILIPNRFEAVINNDFQFKPLILEVKEDLQSFLSIRNKAKVQGGGILSFLLGATGVGKTTSIYSASIYMPNEFTGVYPIPSDITEFGEILTWLKKGNIPSPVKNKAHLILLDGKEVTDDEIGLKQFLSGLNQLLRGRKDLLFFWPTTDREWHKQIRDLAEKIGGTNLVPNNSDIWIQGLVKSQWIEALERVLIQHNKSFDDLAIELDILEKLTEKHKTIGGFLGEVGETIAERVTNVQEYKGLPSIVFVVTSGSEVVSEANRIRRPCKKSGNQTSNWLLIAEQLLAYSPGSSAGKWWKERGEKNLEHNLGYIISLFNARLTTMTPSAVSYACLNFGEQDIKQAVLENQVTRHSSNAKKTLKATDIYRFLTEEYVSENTSSRKGRTKSATANAFVAVQKLSSKRHKVINQAICSMLKQEIDYLSIDDHNDYEVNAGDQQLYTDVIATLKSKELDDDPKKYYLEFHHLSPNNCNAAKMASYIMEKLQKYAIHYNLVPR